MPMEQLAHTGLSNLEDFNCPGDKEVIKAFDGKRAHKPIT